MEESRVAEQQRQQRTRRRKTTAERGEMDMRTTTERTRCFHVAMRAAVCETRQSREQEMFTEVHLAVQANDL